MSRSLEITEIIGSIYVERHAMDSISIVEVKNIMSKINETNQFISIRLSHQALHRALSLARQDTSSKTGIEKITIPKDSNVHSQFIREYYKLDSDTRIVVSKIVKKFISDGKI